jgi:hypothetical protein
MEGELLRATLSKDGKNVNVDLYQDVDEGRGLTEAYGDAQALAHLLSAPKRALVVLTVDFFMAKDRLIVRAIGAEPVQQVKAAKA